MTEVHFTCQEAEWRTFDPEAVQAYMSHWRQQTKISGQLPYRLWERGFAQSPHMLLQIAQQAGNEILNLGRDCSSLLDRTWADELGKCGLRREVVASDGNCFYACMAIHKGEGATVHTMRQLFCRESKNCEAKIRAAFAS